MKVYVTGFGIISALGLGAGATLGALSNRQSGVGPLHWLETMHSHLPCAEVPFSTQEL